MTPQERREVSGTLRLALIGGVATAIVWLETRRRLRQRQREPKAVHSVRNLAIAATAGVVMSAIEAPVARRIADQAGFTGAGIVPRLVESPWARTALAVVLLDYGLYVWHVLTHKSPFLWRFHRVHHADLDLDSSTAIRFHFGEMLASVPWRAAQIYLVGASPYAVSVWQTLLFCSIVFHHANLRLPLGVERRLRFVVTTPRMHGIHHDPDPEQMNSNWSSGLAVWDLLHGTHRWSEEDDRAVGVPGLVAVEQVTLGKCMTMPFRFEQDDKLVRNST